MDAIATTAPLPAPIGPRPIPRAADRGSCELPMAIAAEFVGDILRPYRANARYLKSVAITHVRSGEASPGRGPLLSARGAFCIPESCYIDATGHFNSVEFNICFNQLAYVVFGKCFEIGLVPKVPRLALCDYQQHQLRSCFIVSLASRFSRPLTQDDFYADFVLKKISWTGGVMFCFTSIAFRDWEDVKAEGQVVLAFNPPGGAGRH